MRRDWDTLKAEYAQGNCTLRDLAAKHHLTLGSIGRHAAADGWLQARERYRAKKLQEELEAIIDQRAREHAEQFLMQRRTTARNSP